MSDVIWSRSKRCDTNACVEWRWLQDGADPGPDDRLQLRNSRHPDHVLTLSAGDASELAGAFIRGEIVTFFG